MPIRHIQSDIYLISIYLLPDQYSVVTFNDDQYHCCYSLRRGWLHPQHAGLSLPLKSSLSPRGLQGHQPLLHLSSLKLLPAGLRDRLLTLLPLVRISDPSSLP